MPGTQHSILLGAGEGRGASFLLSSPVAVKSQRGGRLLCVCVCYGFGIGLKLNQGKTSFASLSLIQAKGSLLRSKREERPGKSILPGLCFRITH